MREAYRKNPAHRHALNQKAFQKALAIVNEAKASGCIICGEDDFACLDFHHIDQSLKEYEVSSLMHFRSLKKLAIEIDKCVILCSNCHRKFHAGRFSLLSAVDDKQHCR